LQKLLKIAEVSNNSEFQHDKEADTYELIGDPTEGALSVLARKGGINRYHIPHYKLDDLPFDSTKKLRATLIKDDKYNELYVTGAPEELMERSKKLLTDQGESELNQKEKEQILQKISEWSDHAMRIIGLAYKRQKTNIINEDTIDNLVFVGVVGMIDLPRPDVKEAVKKCKLSGIRVIMVTGDHVNTAVAIAKETGIIEESTENDVVALTEQQLVLLDSDEFDKAIRNISVFARLTPKMKLKIAERLQAMEHLIAMTGDGVNDAPALKQADVGISMGIMGTDVARDSSDVVLADDNFATVVNAVEEGRIVFTNARQASFFLVTTNIAESVTLLVSILLGLPLPLTATQILWLNLVTDGVTGMALATEPGHGEIMKTHPLMKNENILNREVIPFLIINVGLMVGISLAAFYYYIGDSLEKARTGVFIVMAFTQLFNVYNLRNIHKSVFEIGLFSNKYINLAVGVSVLLLILVTEVPVLAKLFNFESIYIIDLILLFGVSSSVLWAGELYKSLNKRK
jgi:Ca2+-transporting ATPase